MRSTPRFGYHASHEQFAPSALLRYAELAEKAGFDTVKSSDHFHPWSGGCHAWRALSRSAMGGGGDGEAINEAITGETWPDKAERNARLLECVEVIRALMAGETVTHRGRIRVLEARLYSRPDQRVPLFGLPCPKPPPDGAADGPTDCSPPAATSIHCAG
jgi:coenzyme F420-dependent glucose-6-phosphate dehydrogenase